MSKKKVGDKLKNVFGEEQSNLENPTETPVAHINEEPSLKERQRRGRPIEHKEEWTKVTVVLLETQIHWLDKLALDIRQNTKAAISRAEIIRALIAAMEESGFDLTKLRSEQDLKNFILTLLKDK